MVATVLARLQPTLRWQTSPSKLDVNKTTSSDNLIEHGWFVYFDVNDNASIDEGDVQLALLYVKSPGSSPTTAYRGWEVY
jgi:hypothetical protein